MPDKEDLSADSVAIIEALLASSDPVRPRTVTDEELVRFACKWSSDEEEEAVLDALTTSPHNRQRFVELLEQLPGHEGSVRLDLASAKKEPLIYDFARKAVLASLRAFSSLSFPPAKLEDADAARVLAQALRDIRDRITQAPTGFASVRGESVSPLTVHIDDQGALIAGGLAGEGDTTLEVTDRVFGEIAVGTASGESFSVPDFGTQLGLPAGPLPAGAFQIRRSPGPPQPVEMQVWVSFEGKDISLSLAREPAIAQGRLTVDLEHLSGLEGYRLGLDLRAGSVLIHLGEWSIDAENAILTVDLGDIEDGPVPVAALAFSLKRSA